MSQPPLVPLAQMFRAAPRLVERPDLSPVLTDFCPRTRSQADIPVEITSIAAPQRLASILWESRLRALVTYSRDDDFESSRIEWLSLSDVPGLIAKRDIEFPW